MAKAKVKVEEGFDVTYEGMPGADKVSEEEASSFGEDLSFGLDNQGNPLEEETNENTEETDAVEETAEENTEAEEEVVAEEEGELDSEEADQESTTENDDGDTSELPEETIAEEPVEEKQKSPMVPKARLDEVLAKQKALQKQLNEQAQAQAEIQAEAPVYDFDTKELEYQQLVLDMEPEKATLLRQEIRQAEKETMMFEMQQQMGQTVQLNQEAVQLQATAQVLQEQHPILDENSQEFNEATASEVIELRDAFIVQGYQAADALTKATKYVVGNIEPITVAQEAPKQNVESIQKKKVAAVKKKIDASQSQPPELKGQGNAERGEGTLDVNSLSEDEFNALPEETLRRLRGDFG
jgi:hypothetical protein|tara:strand:- start:770 stop:1831 length:1062 start_codon:yes stop_codon:yes gene_type:complete